MFRSNLFLWIQSNLNNFFRVWWGGEGWSWGEITVYFIERFHCIRKQTKEMMMTKLKAMRSSLLSSKLGLNICNGWNSSFHMQRWVMFSSSQKYVFFYSLFGADIINLLNNFLVFFLLFKPFLPKDETHYYFFRKWRKDDLKYYSEMEYFNVS